MADQLKINEYKIIPEGSYFRIIGRNNGKFIQTALFADTQSCDNQIAYWMLDQLLNVAWKFHNHLQNLNRVTGYFREYQLKASIQLESLLKKAVKHHADQTIQEFKNSGFTMMDAMNVNPKSKNFEICSNKISLCRRIVQDFEDKNFDPKIFEKNIRNLHQTAQQTKLF